MSDLSMESRSESVDTRRGVFDFLAVACVGLVVLFLELYGDPTRRGFFCDDDSIKYPYKRNTVSEGTIVAAAILTPIIVVLLTEIWNFGLNSRNRINWWRFSVPGWLVSILQFSGVYLLGIAFAQIASDMGKFTIGRLRPHFLAVCLPNVTCTDTNLHVYVDDYVCAGDPHEVMEARMSFPSGHATLSFYASIYIIAYMQGSRCWRRFGFARHIVQFLFFISAWYISLTRIMDNWHHWSDVVVGACLGSGTAMAVIKYASDLRLSRSRDDTEEHLPLRKTVVSCCLCMQAN